MLETTVKIPKQLKELNGSLQALSEKPSFEQAQAVVNNVVSLLGISASNEWKPFNDSQGKIRSNAGWFMVAEGFADKRAAYKLADNNPQRIDLKCFWMKKLNKSIISWLVALTPNFEDEPFYGNLNFGIDFVIPEEASRILVVLSKNYVIRTVELQNSLSVTQQDIFNAWLTDFNYSNKAQVHEILWKSFDLEPVNKSFYKGISAFFVELKQFLAEDVKVFDEKHAAYFTNRLIGRILFCWFLNKKGIINPEMRYFHIGDIDAAQYYHQKLETLFFKVFNTPLEERILKSDQKTPFLNGGLFEVKDNDKIGDPTIVFPKDFFDRLYAFLRHYNFTTDESTASFQQVAIDPEMLGRIFENLLAEQVEETGEQARKAKGAFYTPREIVDYMCRESLREYLKTKIPEDDLRDQRIGLLLDVKPHEFRDQQRNYRGDLKSYKYDILKALDEIKIIDPACGSGAFPMGMLHLMLDMYDRLDVTFDPYKKKINIIKNNLFGVDIEPMAVEICRLRAWLSIVVDEESDSKKIEPLPNLDFKFICANSLVPLKEENDKYLFDMINKDEVVEIRDKYFNARTLKSKDNLRKKFEKKIDYKGSGNMFSSDREKQLRTYHPFDSENVTQFFDAEFMFGIKQGFDVVIGNPPYVNISKVDKKLLSSYKKQYVAASYGRFDLYVVFMELAKKILNSDGIQSFIVPDKICYQKYAQNIRRIILDNYRIVKILNFSGVKIFESAVVDNIVYVFRRSGITSGLISVMSPNYRGIFKGIVDCITYDIKQDAFKTFPENMFRLSVREKDMSILRKIDSKSDRIKDFCYVSFGAQPGVLSKFVFNRKKDTKKIDKNKEQQRKFIRGRNIDRFIINYSDDIIYYLPKQLHRPAFPELFENEKIMVAEISKDIKAAYDSSGYYSNEKTVIIIRWDVFERVSEKVKRGRGIKLDVQKVENSQKVSLKYLTALLNSSLMSYYFKKMYSDGLNVYPDNIRELPIFWIKDQKEIEYLVDKIANEKLLNRNKSTKLLEEEIDNLVFDLYEFTPEERRIIMEN